MLETKQKKENEKDFRLKLPESNENIPINKLNIPAPKITYSIKNKKA